MRIDKSNRVKHSTIRGNDWRLDKSTKIGFSSNRTQVGKKRKPTRTSSGKTTISSRTKYSTTRSKGKSRSKRYSSKSKMKASLLGIFMGFISAHRFYLGKPKSALIQIFVFYSGLFLMQEFRGAVLLMIWPIIDVILILSGSFKDSEGRKVSRWK